MAGGSRETFCRTPPGPVQAVTPGAFGRRENKGVPFADRFEAGKMLAARLSQYAGRSETGVFALPRGGVPVGYEVARALDLPLDVFLVRKLGVPGHEELAMGAIASGGVRVINQDVVNLLHISPQTIEVAAERETQELKRREREYRENRPPAEFRGRTIILTDDGLATGSTMRAAVTALRRERAGRIVVAVPVGAGDACRAIREVADETLCLESPENFLAVGDWYVDFWPTSDAEVRALLVRLEKERSSQYAKRD
jgi:putative phosphoribosyl transferase